MNTLVKTWGVDTGIRAVKTSAQTLVALFGASAFNVLNNVPWGADLGVALGAGVICVLQNVQSFPVGGAAADVPVPPTPEVGAEMAGEPVDAPTP